MKPALYSKQLTF